MQDPCIPAWKGARKRRNHDGNGIGIGTKSRHRLRAASAAGADITRREVGSVTNHSGRLILACKRILQCVSLFLCRGEAPDEDHEERQWSGFEGIKRDGHFFKKLRSWGIAAHRLILQATTAGASLRGLIISAQ